MQLPLVFTAGDVRSVAEQPKTRMGALPARFAFALNELVDARFTACPRCEAKTRARKIPLVIHVDGAGLVVLRKTCRLCVNCEMLIAHKDEIEPLIAALGDGMDRPEYMVLGTVEPRVWRRGASSTVTVEDLVQHMADFEAYMNLEVTPGGWHRSADRAPK